MMSIIIAKEMRIRVIFIKVSNCYCAAIKNYVNVVDFASDAE